MLRSLLLLCCVLSAWGCPSFEAPEYGSVECIRNVDNMRECHFSCSNWTNLLGASVLTCQANDTWDDEPPICTPNYALCHLPNAKCPPLSKKIWKEGKKRREFLPQDVKEELLLLESILEVTPRGARLPCKSQMCYIACSCLKRKSWSRQCIRCKKNKKLLKCSRGGTLFGR